MGCRTLVQEIFPTLLASTLPACSLPLSHWGLRATLQECGNTEYYGTCSFGRSGTFFPTSTQILWDRPGKSDLLGGEPEKRAPALRVEGAASSREDQPHTPPESASQLAAGRRGGRVVMASRPGAAAMVSLATGVLSAPRRRRCWRGGSATHSSPCSAAIRS